jgi:hypothetical protein
MAEASIQINKLSSNAYNVQKACLNSSSSSHDTGANFDKILQNISAPTTSASTKISQNENNSQLVVNGGGACDDSIQNDSTNYSSASIDDVEIGEYLQITPKQVRVDTRVKTDLSLLTLAENAIINNTSGAQDIYKSAELDFFCPTVQLSYEDHEENEKSNNDNNKLPQLQIEATEFTGGDVRFIKIGQKIELNFPKIQLNYSKYETYSQNQPEACDSLPFVSSGVDAKEVRSFDFVDLNFKSNETLSDADYRYGHNAYFNSVKSITNAKINFSLDSLDGKLINQVNFFISATTNQKENNTVVQLEPAELGKIEIIVSNQGKERSIVVNSDKISTFELLKKHGDEFLSSIKSSDSENDITTNLSFNYKDLSQNGADEDNQLQKRRISVGGKNNTLLNGVTEHRMSLMFVPFDIDKNVDVWV